MRLLVHGVPDTLRLVLLFCLLAAGTAIGQTITTIAGNGIAGSAGDGGAPTSASLDFPGGVYGDTSGVLYIADTGNHRIRQVSAAGTITTLAGTGTQGFAGDSAAAASARLNSPSGVFVTSSGVLYIADTGNHRIRQVSAAGTITTLAGTGTQGFAGDSGPATSAQLNSPAAVFADTAGNLYIADTGNHRIRRVTPSGTITTIAGGNPGFAGDGDLPVNAQLSFPRAVVVDSAGTLYIADRFNHRIRRINPSGNITTLAGEGSFAYGGDEGPANLAKLANPSGLFLDRAGSLYIADTGNHRIRRVSPNDSRGLAGSRTVPPGGEVQILRVALAGDGATGVRSLTFTLADLDTSTGLSRSDFVEFRLYESADTLLDRDTRLGTLSVDQFSLNSPATVQAAAVPFPPAGVERYYILSALISPTATEGHAFKLGFATGNLATTKGGRGSRVAPSSANRMTIDAIATRLVFATQPRGVISGQPFLVQPVVKAVDDSGFVDGNFTDVVTLSSTGSGALLLNTASAVAGVATFSSLTYIAATDDEVFALTADDQSTGSEGDLPAATSASLIANAVNDTPRVDFPSLVLKEDESFTTPVASVVTDPDDTLFTFTFASGHLRGSTAGGQLTIAPEPDWYGVDTLTITASDPFGLKASDRSAVEVTPVNDPPRLSLPEVISFAEDDSLALDLRSRVADPEDPFADLSWSFTPSPPLSATFASGVLTLRAPAENSGQFRLALQVTDRSFGLARDTVQVTIAPVNDPPRLALPDTSLRQGGSLALDLKRFAADPDHALSQLTWSGASTAHTAVSITAAGIASLQPDPDFFGADTLVFTIADPAGALTADTAVVRVIRVNRPPVLAALPDTAIAPGDTLTWDLRQFAADPDDGVGALSWSIQGGRRSQVSIAGGLLVLIPLQGGTYSEQFQIRATDPLGLADTTSLTVRVRPLPPLIADLPDTSFSAGDTLRLELDRYAASGGLSWSARAGGNLRVALDPEARIAAITAIPGWKGRDSLIFQAADSAGHTAADTLQVTVLNPPPVVDFPELFVEAGVLAQLSLDLFARDDEPLDRLLWSAVPDPEIPVSINNALRQATLLPAQGFAGQARILFRAVDAQGAIGADTAVVTVRASEAPDTSSVNPLQAPQLLGFPALSLVAGDSLRLELDRYVRSDPTALTWTAISDSGVQVRIDPSSRLATLIPAPGFVGQTQVAFQAVDPEGNSAFGTAQVEVAPGPGDFDGSGRVDFEDFFRFAEHMGQGLGQPGWDPVYDLDQDGQITLEDFFRFADLFNLSQARLSQAQ